MRFRSKILMLAIAILPALVASAPAATVDMRSITCGDYLAMPAASANKFSAWMTGWFSYQTNKTYVDFDIHRANVASVRTWCQGHATASVMSALENPVVVKGIADPSTDFNKITCGKWLAYGPDDREFVTYFMSGYYNANASHSILDYDRLQKNLTAVSTYCSKNKSRTLPTAIQTKAK